MVMASDQLVSAIGQASARLASLRFSRCHPRVLDSSNLFGRMEKDSPVPLQASSTSVNLVPQPSGQLLNSGSPRVYISDSREF